MIKPNRRQSQTLTQERRSTMRKINRTGPNPRNPKPKAGPTHQSGTGGGANYSQPPIRTGTPTTKKTSIDAVGNIGRSVGDHTTERGTVKRPNEPLSVDVKAPVRMGNDLAQSLGVGVGVGYVVHRSGSQGQHGAVAGSPKPQGRDILSDFGPERGGGRR
jgi:hypothetical protein